MTSLSSSSSAPNGAVERKRRGPESNRCFPPLLAELERGRRLRLEWACQGDLERAAGVARLIAAGRSIDKDPGHRRAAQLGRLEALL